MSSETSLASNEPPIVMQTALSVLKSTNDQSVAIGTIGVAELFYDYHYYNYAGRNNAIQDPKVRSKAVQVVQS